MAGGAGRLVIALAAIAGAAGCFVDAIGEATSGDAPASATSSSGSSGSTDAASTASSSSASAGAGGSGGSAGGGGAACTDMVLDFDESDSARLQTAEADIGDDFTVGAWVFPKSGPSFMPGGGNHFEWIIDHADLDDDDGYLIGIGEVNDTGMPWASFVAFPNGVECAANAPIVFDDWVHIAGRYSDNVAGPDLFLLVDGIVVASANCGEAPPVDEHRGPVVLGRRDQTGGQHFLGMLDDVFLKRGGNVDPFQPLVCDASFVFAFDFESGLASLCNDAPLELALDPSPSDPTLVCAN